MWKYFLSKKLKCPDRGFTLIELVIVSVIIGVLSAIAIPGLLTQVGKSRETEALSQLGALSRSQQGFHFETQEFASSISVLGQNGLDNSNYYSFPDPSVASNTLVKHQATSKVPYDVASRNFSIGVYFDSGAFRTALCKAQFPTASVTAPDDPIDDCSDNGIRIE